MSRLFLRVSAGLIAALLLANLLEILVIRDLRRRASREVIAQNFEGVIGLLRPRLIGLDQQQLEDELGQLEQQFGYPFAMEQIADLPLDAEESQRLRSGQVVAIRPRGQPPTVFGRFDAGERALALGPVPRPDRQHRVLDVVVAALGVVIALLVGAVLAIPMVRRLRRLQHAAEDLAAGDLSVRTHDSHRDELGSLARSFDSMAGTLSELIQGQRQLLQAVSHELRTPMARLRFGVELLAKEQDLAAREQRSEELDRDLDELDALVDELLAFNRYGAQAPPLRREELNLADALDELVTDHRHVRADVQIAIDLQLSEDLTLWVAPQAFRRAQGNILVNAIRHARGRVELRAETTPDAVHIAISDDGQGIPEAERQRVLEPFTRLDSDRNRSSGGVGLGLAIAQRIVAHHGGQIVIGEGPHGGARFVTSWPSQPRRSS